MIVKNIKLYSEVPTGNRIKALWNGFRFLTQNKQFVIAAIDISDTDPSTYITEIYYSGIVPDQLGHMLIAMGETIAGGDQAVSQAEKILKHK